MLCFTYYVSCVFALNFLLFINIEAAYFPTVCKLDDSACIKKVANSFLPTFAVGIPEIGLESTDPLTIKEVDASSNNIKLTLRDLYFDGLKDSKIKHIKFDEQAKTAEMKIEIKFKCNGNYDMKGQLLFLAIEGKGPVHVTIRKMILTVKVGIKEQIKNGKTYWYFELKEKKYEFKEKSDVVFENLFNGNEVLAEAAKAAIAENGNEILLEVEEPVIQATVVAVLVRINEMFLSTPIDELRIK